MTHDEKYEIAISPAALANWAENQYRTAVTEMLELNAPPTLPHGVLIPFPGAPEEYALPPRGRHLKPQRMIPTWRLVGLAGTIGAAGAAILSLVIR